VKVKTVSEDTKTQSNPLEDLNSDEKQNQVISFEPKNSNEEFDPKANRFECMSCGFIYDPDEGIKKLNMQLIFIIAGEDFTLNQKANIEIPFTGIRIELFTQNIFVY